VQKPNFCVFPAQYLQHFGTQPFNFHCIFILKIKISHSMSMQFATCRDGNCLEAESTNAEKTHKEQRRKNRKQEKTVKTQIS
jgi:hypothetical protein